MVHFTPRAWLAPSFALLLALLLPALADASDGIIELNQACATLTGCAPGDAPLFPITLIARGSYRLTSDLEVPDENTNGIEISSDDITIDFNGFTLFGQGFVDILTHQCTRPGSGSGIRDLGPASGFVAVNGRVRGMGLDGVSVVAANARLERMVAERNCNFGFALGAAAFVADTQARANGNAGIEVGTGSRLRDSVADNNGVLGIRAGSGSVVTGSVATVNGGKGIEILGSGGVAMGNAVHSNVGAGITLPGGIATLNSAWGNLVGFEVGPGSGPPGSGLNSSVGNSQTDVRVPGFIRIGCDVESAGQVCP